MVKLFLFYSSDDESQVVSEPPSPTTHWPSSSSGKSPESNPKVVLSFIGWEQRHVDLRGVLAHFLNAHLHFSEGHVLSAIEIDTSEEMGG